MAQGIWVKFYVDQLDDVRLARLGDRAQLRFYQLNLLAGACDAAGALISGDQAMDPAEMAWRLRAQADAVAQDLLELQAAGFADQDEDGTWVLVDFAELQGPTQAEKRAQWRSRQAAKRARAKKKIQVINGTAKDLDSAQDPAQKTVTTTEEERGGKRRKETETESEEEEEETGKKPTPPPDTLDLSDLDDQIKELLAAYTEHTGHTPINQADALEQIKSYWIPAGITCEDVQDVMDELNGKRKEYTLSGPKSLNNALGILKAKQSQEGIKRAAQNRRYADWGSA